MRAGSLRPCGTPLGPAAAAAFPPPERLHQAPRPDQLGRGGAPAAGLRDAHRRPLRRATVAGARASTAEVCNAGKRAGHADLRPRRDALADQPGLDARANTRAIGFVPRHGARLLGARMSRTGRRRPTTRSRRARQARRSRSSRTGATACSSEPGEALDEAVMASLQAALKNAIQVEFQLEDSELAAEPLPESGESPIAAVLRGRRGRRRRAAPPGRRSRRLRAGRPRALRLCHFDPDTGEDLRRAPGAREDCEAACYDCLMSYANQRDHALLDRQLIAICCSSGRGQVSASPVSRPAQRPSPDLLNLCDSELERDWLAAGHRAATPADEAQCSD